MFPIPRPITPMKDVNYSVVRLRGALASRTPTIFCLGIDATLLATAVIEGLEDPSYSHQLIHISRKRTNLDEFFSLVYSAVGRPFDATQFNDILAVAPDERIALQGFENELAGVRASSEALPIIIQFTLESYYNLTGRCQTWVREHSLGHAQCQLLYLISGSDGGIPRLGRVVAFNLDSESFLAAYLFQSYCQPGSEFHHIFSTVIHRLCDYYEQLDLESLFTVLVEFWPLVTQFLRFHEGSNYVIKSTKHCASAVDIGCLVKTFVNHRARTRQGAAEVNPLLTLDRPSRAILVAVFLSNSLTKTHLSKVLSGSRHFQTSRAAKVSIYRGQHRSLVAPTAHPASLEWIKNIYFHVSKLFTLVHNGAGEGKVSCEPVIDSVAPLPNLVSDNEIVSFLSTLGESGDGQHSSKEEDSGDSQENDDLTGKLEEKDDFDFLPKIQELLKAGFIRRSGFTVSEKVTLEKKVLATCQMECLLNMCDLTIIDYLVVGDHGKGIPVYFNLRRFLPFSCEGIT